MLALEIDIPCPVSQSDSESISEEHNQSPSNKVLQCTEVCFAIFLSGGFIYLLSNGKVTERKLAKPTSPSRSGQRFGLCWDGEAV